MTNNNVLERYLDALLKGDRRSCQSAIEETLQIGTPANNIYIDIIWPVMVEIENLLRSERITPAAEHLATRINRTIVAQLQNKLPRRPCKNKKIVICCTDDQMQELGAQIMADLFEGDGWEVRFLGGGLTSDDVLAFINESGPDVLMIYGATSKQAPDIRQLIKTIKSVNAWPSMRIMLSGGVFNRAEGLWQEIGADLFTATAIDALRIASCDNPEELLEAEPETTNRRRRRRRKKPEPVTVQS